MYVQTNVVLLCCVGSDSNVAAAVGMRSEVNVRKIENQELVSSSLQCTSTPVGFGQGIFKKELCDNNGASPIPYRRGFSWLSPVPSTEINIEGTALL